jgi:Reverse transcriptase (RNA-dependent DNA polymerase)
LIATLEKTTQGVLAYADDLAFVAKDRCSMMAAIKDPEEWCKKNDMELNKKKSAIMVLKMDNKTRDVNKDSEIGGVPVTKEYKYLGLFFSDTARTT